MISETTPTQSPRQIPHVPDPPPPRAGEVQFSPEFASAVASSAEPYTVRPGDNLSRIVRDQLRAAGLPASPTDVYQGVRTVAQANGLKNVDLIHPGQRLDMSALVPAPAALASNVAAAPVAAAKVGPNAIPPTAPPRPPVPAPTAGLPLERPPGPASAAFRTARAAALPEMASAATLARSAGGEPLRGRVMGSKRVALAPTLESKVRTLSPELIAGVPPPPLVPSVSMPPRAEDGLGGPQASAMKTIKMAAVNTLRADAVREWLDGVFEGPRPNPANPWASTLDVKARLTSEFGMRHDPFTGRPAFHAGIDLAAKTGSAIRAYKPGIVVFSGWQSGYGKTVIVRHEDGHESLYAHNSKNLVNKGDRVTSETILAEVGATGRATGPHLHFEIRKNGKAVNPIPYLNPKETVAHKH